ncbi:hypothetical protein AERO_09455 [Aeromicrobium fastidiosum]|uniref:hypothetical protein n=1 Tax=Aeromicrobium fastidiosum TaxID=52699 RepID=UPI00202352F7|nr:hypothetical protein [Aeromicrobium fastidiosum]MCL8251606.1 hypothetical protein [Aeromicrobium fastidiosum]
MTFASFRDALVATMPGLILGNDEDELSPDGYTRVSFHLAPVQTGARLTIRFSGSQYAIDVADEHEAAEILAQLMNLGT